VWRWKCDRHWRGHCNAKAAATPPIAAVRCAASSPYGAQHSLIASLPPCRAESKHERIGFWIHQIAKSDDRRGEICRPILLLPGLGKLMRKWPISDDHCRLLTCSL
jgi:hypothetical protein